MRQMISKVVFQAPVDVVRGLTGLARDVFANWVHKPKHFVFHKKNPGLGKLFHHRFVTMETLYEHRSKYKEGKQVRIYALFRYQGGNIFLGGNGMRIHSGDVISAEFCLGKKPGEFCIEGSVQNMLPKHILLYWQKNNSHGTIIPASVI